MISITNIDHFVLTVASIEVTCDFYERVLGMGVETFGDTRKALRFGDQKINLHQAGHEFEPKAEYPTKGSADFCLLTCTAMQDVVTHIKNCSVEIEDGPVARTGATGPILSVYIRDPDQNLVEISVQQASE